MLLDIFILFRLSFFFSKMRICFLIPAFAALVLAAPRPQDTEYDGVDQAPDADDVTPPVNIPTDVVPTQPAAAAATIAEASITDVYSTKGRRDFLDVSYGIRKRGEDGDCAIQPYGTGPEVQS